MIIKLTPMLPSASLGVVRSKDILVVNGVSLDFGKLQEGATLPADAIGSEWFVGPAERRNGKLIFVLRLPCDADAPMAALYPDDIIDPADGIVGLPGLLPTEPSPTVAGIIDWSQMITAEQKDQAAADQLLTHVTADIAQRRSIADTAIAPLQDAVDLDIATDAEAALLKDWKRYRVALNRLPEQPDYPAETDWPAPPV